MVSISVGLMLDTGRVAPEEEGATPRYCDSKKSSVH